MKNIVVIILGMLMLVSCGPAKELTPEEKAEKLQREQVISSAIENKGFVIEAHTVYDKYGESYNMSPSINFVLVNNEDGTIQLGFDQIVGWNGVGGITLDGKVRDYKVVEREGSLPSISFSMNGVSVGNVTLNVSVNSHGMATAVVNGNWGERITFRGQFRSLSESSIYKGNTNYPM